jgi:hypothetical protein
LLNWFQELQKELHSATKLESAPSRCAPPTANTPIRPGSGEVEKAASGQGSRPPYLFRLYASHYYRGSADASCTIVFANGSFHRELSNQGSSPSFDTERRDKVVEGQLNESLRRLFARRMGPRSAAAQTKADQLAQGCTQETVGIMANGAIIADDHQPRRISLEIVKLISDILEVGGEGRAEVRLRNVGEMPIQIPWSKDSSAIREAPSPDHLDWEQGSLRVVLRDKQNHRIALTSERWLFGSQFVTGSQMTIKPREWITAFLSFKVEDMYHTRSAAEFPIGDAKLFVEWRQARRVWDREKCTWRRAWFDYEGYYRQEQPTTVVQIKQSVSANKAKSD